MIRSTELHTDASKIETRSLRCQVIEQVTLIIPKNKTATVKKKAAKKKMLTIAEANAWLVANSAKVNAHAKASTRRLIGRDSV